MKIKKKIYILKHLKQYRINFHSPSGRETAEAVSIISIEAL